MQQQATTRRIKLQNTTCLYYTLLEIWSIHTNYLTRFTFCSWLSWFPLLMMYLDSPLINVKSLTDNIIELSTGIGSTVMRGALSISPRQGTDLQWTPATSAIPSTLWGGIRSSHASSGLPMHLPWMIQWQWQPHGQNGTQSPICCVNIYWTIDWLL